MWKRHYRWDTCHNGCSHTKKSRATDAPDVAFHFPPITSLLSPGITPPHKSHLSPRSSCTLFVHPTPPLPRAGGKEEHGNPRTHLYIPFGGRTSPPPSAPFIALDGALLGLHCLVRLLSPTRFPLYPIHHESSRRYNSGLWATGH